MRLEINPIILEEYGKPLELKDFKAFIEILQRVAKKNGDSWRDILASKYVIHEVNRKRMEFMAAQEKLGLLDYNNELITQESCLRGAKLGSTNFLKYLTKKHQANCAEIIGIELDNFYKDKDQVVLDQINSVINSQEEE